MPNQNIHYRFHLVFKSFLVILFFLLIRNITIAQNNSQQPVFHNFESDHFGGYSIKSAIYSETNEKMWLSTNKGLAYFNGYKTFLYPSNKEDNNSPLSNLIYELYEDKQGVLWFGYEDVGALTSFNFKNGKFIHYKYDSTSKNSFPDAVVSKFLESSDNKLYVSTWGGGIFVIDKERSKTKLITNQSFSNKDVALRSNATRAMLELEPQKILVSYFQEQPFGYPGVFDVKKNTITPFPIDDYKGNLSEKAFQKIKNMLAICHFIYKDNYNKLWFGTYSGLAYIDLTNKTCKRVSGRPFDEENVVNIDNTINYIVDDNDRLWVSTVNSGIMIVDLKTTRAFYHTQGNNCSNCIADNKIYNFTRDNDNNIWVANGTKGLSVYSPYKQQIRLREWKELNVDFANPSHQSIPLTYFFVRNNKCLYLLSMNGISIYDYQNDSLLEKIYPNKRSPNSEMYFRLTNNFRLHNQNLYLSITFPIADKINQYYSIGAKYNLKDKRLDIMDKANHSYGMLFPNDTVSENSYVLSIAYNNVLKYNHKNSLDTFFIFPDNKCPTPRFSEILSNGSWFISSGNKSFLVFNPINKSILSYGPGTKKYDREFNDSLIEGIYYNKKNTVWIYTRNGLNSYDVHSGKIKNWNKELGFDQIPIHNAIEDKNGNIWFTSTNEIYHYNFSSKNLICYNKSLGFQNYSFDHKSSIHYSVTDGENVFFPSVKGLIYFNINKINPPKTIPVLNLSSVTINDSVLTQTKIDDLRNNSIDLPYYSNNLTFELNTNQLYSPSANYFKYKLNGLNEKWINNESSNKIVLQNLPNGSYTLEVICKNAYGIESKTFTISFQINKPFWKSWWFILLSLSCLVFIIIQIIKSREKTLQKRQIELEKIVDERTQEVVSKAQEIHNQKELIEEKQKEIVDSIKYAQRIQKALLASKTLLDQHLNHYFIFFNPKDLVSGDFYWATHINKKFYFIVADSTGHGVPGAFMSLLNISFLNEAINERKIEKPGDILNYVRQRLIQSLAEDGSSEGGKDGMDCSLICFDFTAKKLEYACAHNPVVVIRNNELIELNNDRMPVGKSPKENIGFNTYEFKFEKGDTLYILTDGYADQFGGESGKKLKLKNLKNYLLTNSGVDMQQQEQILSELFYKWKGNLEQIDDVTIAGIKL